MSVKTLGLFLLLSGVSALAYAADADQAVIGYAWRIFNYVVAIAVVAIAIGLAWCMTDLAIHGQKARQLLMGLVGLGCIWGLVSMVGTAAEESGTSVQGFQDAAKFDK